MNLLTINLLWPLFTLLILALFSNQNNEVLHRISLWSSSISVCLSILLLIFFDKNLLSFQFQSSLFLVPSLNFNILLGIDGISIYFLFLTNLFIYLSILSLNKHQARLLEFLFHLFILQWGVLSAFSVLDFLGFFIFFEATLIPIYLIILIWGSRERKVRASYLIALYTMFGSIFMFLNILYLLSKTGTTNYLALWSLDFSEEEQKFLWITFFIAFAVKVPLYPLHIWLPEAHVEAPTVGSVLLAALLLKLGIYGLIRFSLPLFPLGSIYYTPLVYCFAVFGILYTCFIAIRQIDLKKIIAYASVGHMNVVLIGIMALTVESLEGAVFQMLSHGIVSGGLFFAVGSLYERYGVRSVTYYGGLTHVYPLLAIIFLIFSMANISFPGTSSFVGEFLILGGSFQRSPVVVFFASISMVLGAVYTLWMYNRVFFGNLKTEYILKYKDLTRKEVYMYSVLIIILFIMGLFPSFILHTFHGSILHLIEHTFN